MFYNDNTLNLIIFPVNVFRFTPCLLICCCSSYEGVFCTMYVNMIQSLGTWRQNVSLKPRDI